MCKVGEFLNRVKYDSLSDMANAMCHCYDHVDIVSAIASYDISVLLLSELIKHNIPIGQLIIWDESYNDYDKEFQITIMDNAIYCCPIFARIQDGYKLDRYLDTYGDVMFVHQDCNSSMLKHIESKYLFEFSINNIDDE